MKQYKKAIAIISLILGIFLSFQFSEAVSGWLAQYIEGSGEVLQLVAFALILICVIAGLAALGKLLEGMLKIVIFLLYLIFCSKQKDIYRVFQYHGAEHKTIHAFEAGGMVTVATARAGSRLHPRCGTTFLLFVLSLAIVLHAVLVPLLLLLWHPEYAPLRHAGIVLFKILLIVPVSAMAYELIRYAAMLEDGLWCRVLRAPGLFLQLLTTREPDDAQLEVAVAALREALGPDSPYADRFEPAENTVTE